MMDLPDLSLTWIISVSAPVLLLTYFWFSRRNPKYPPCPLRPWPIVGNLLQLNPDPREQLAGFRKQCGDIYSLYLGPSHLVVLNGLDVAKEAYVSQGEDFSDRAEIFIDIVAEGFNKATFAINDDIWKEHKIFATSVLKRFGFSTSILSDKIQDEVRQLVDLLESFNGEPKNIQSFLNIAVSNVMCSFLTGERNDFNEKQFQRIHEIVIYSLSLLKGTLVLNWFPWLKYLPGDLFKSKIIENHFREFSELFVKHHMKKNENVDGEPTNLIAAYFQEMRKKEARSEPTYMCKEKLLRLILNFFIAGTETGGMTIGWFVLYMIHFPEIQERIFQDIKGVVGLERAPTMQDKLKLNYLTAAIMEVQRLIAIVPQSVPRQISRDVHLREYVIPKGAKVIVNFESIQHDSAFWGEDVHKFRPERFIAEDGRLLSPEAWVPFSLGRRVCLGEGMAKMELFLFAANILQRFQVLPADPNKIPPIKGTLGLIHCAVPFDVRLVSRRSK